jgi:hypothetical protein
MNLDRVDSELLIHNTFLLDTELGREESSSKKLIMQNERSIVLCNNGKHCGIIGNDSKNRSSRLPTLRLLTKKGVCAPFC